jgi:hypothetical protein
MTRFVSSIDTDEARWEARLKAVAKTVAPATIKSAKKRGKAAAR